MGTTNKSLSLCYNASKLIMITASSLYTISTYERFRRNAPLLVSRENLYMKTDRTGTFLIWFSGLILFELLSFIF